MIHNLDKKANEIHFDKNISDMSANNVQGAIDEVSRTLGYTMSKNLLKLAGVVGTSLTAHSVTITKTDENIYTLNGTSSNNAWIELGYAIKSGTEPQENYIFGLDENKSYCVSVLTEGTITNTTGKNVNVNLFADSDPSVTINIVDNVNTNIVTNAQGISRIWIYIPSGVTFNNVTLKLQLEEGTEVTEFEPCVEDVKTRVDRLYGVKEINFSQELTMSTSLTTLYTYTADRKCLINITYNPIYNNHPVRQSRITINGATLLELNSSNPDGCHVVPVTYLLNKGDVLRGASMYSSESKNRLNVRGYVQFLE